MHPAVIASETDFDGFRHSVRTLLAEHVPPDDVVWSVGNSAPDLFLPDAPAVSAPPSQQPRPSAPTACDDRRTGLRVSPGWLSLAERVLRHRDPGRLAFLYRLLWRLANEPALRDDALDADRLRAEAMAKAVDRDLHKMKAFVRFRPVGDAAASSTEHVAWFEPQHRIVETAAPFFVRRFAGIRWALLTPDRSARWDGETLRFGPGARRDDAPAADDGERLWLTYYESIFNPSRLKLTAMQREMPRRYWVDLPEARLIAPLAARAASQSESMIERGGSVVARRLPRPRSVVATEAEMTVRGTPEPTDRPLNAAASAPASARSLRQIPLSLATLKTATDRCRECPIGYGATQSVVGEGADSATLMVVGEQPGDHEDLRGRPFVGPAGQLLDRALAQLGWPREAVYVTNAVKHFKYELRGKRRIHKTPAQQEAAACLHWLESEIEWVGPRALLALGATAARSLLGRPVAVMKERGTWLQRADGRHVLVTLHPSALLRLQADERDAAYASWLADLRKASRFVAPSGS